MMKSISTWKQELTEGAHAARLAALYCCTPQRDPCTGSPLCGCSGRVRDHLRRTYRGRFV